MPTFAHFELIEPVHEDVANTWLAREPGSGRLLLLHKFSRASGLREKIRTMNPPDLGMLVKAGEESGLFYVVTYDRPELRHFREWVESRSRLKAAGTYPPSVEHSDPAKTGLWKPAAAPQAPAVPPGEFTRMFEAPAADQPKAAPARQAPGEFTRMFEAQAQISAEAEGQGAEPERTRTTEVPGSAPEEPGRPQANQSEAATGEFAGFPEIFQQPLGNAPRDPEARTSDTAPGEFTQMFAARPPEAPPVQESPARAASNRDRAPKPGEFTRMFSAPPSVADTAAPAPDARPSGEAGEFTRMFRQPANGPATEEREMSDHQTADLKPAQMPPPISPPTPPGEFTRIFQQPAAPGAPPADESPLEPHVMPKAAPQAPGEFTRMFQQPAPAAPSSAALPGPGAQRPQAAESDFTKFFGNQMPSTPIAEDLNRPRAAPPPPPRDAGNFTRMFGKQEPPPAATLPGSGATGVFSNPGPRSSAPAPAGGPGEYTRLFSAPAEAREAPPATEPSAPAANAPAPAPPIRMEAKPPVVAAAGAPGNYTALIVILAVLAVIAIALILFFVLRK